MDTNGGEAIPGGGGGRLAAAAMAVAALGLLAPGVAGGLRPVGLPFASRSEVLARGGMAATSQPLATQAALEILRAGGSAADAAIAANACLALMEPTGCGLGGDLFALVWDAPSGRLLGLNAAGRAPAGLTIELVRGRGHDLIPAEGPLPITVPGAVSGWAALHARSGRLPWADLFAPAIRYARDGFPVSAAIAWYWETGLNRHGARPNVRETFGIEGGRAPRAGEVFRNPGLARTLERIAADGPAGFYRGEVAATIARFVQEQGGVLSADDLAAQEAAWVEPVSTSYRGHDVWALPPPTHGVATLQILNLLEGYDFSRLPWGSAEHLHLFVEAKKLAFEDRARFLGDPATLRVRVSDLLDKDYAARRRRAIDPARAARTVPPGEVPGGADTIYLTVADGAGNFVSLIQSNYRGMGSGVVPPGLGFMLQNRGEQFSLDPAHPNALAPGKQPFHTIIPGFVTKDGQPWLSFGVMGGAYQPQGQAWILMNLIDYGMNLQEAADAPRVEHDGSSEPIGVGASAPTMSDGGFVLLEPGFPVETGRDLDLRLGHRVRIGRPNFGGFQGIRVLPGGVLAGASEMRKDGHAAGF